MKQYYIIVPARVIVRKAGLRFLNYTTMQQMCRTKYLSHVIFSEASVVEAIDENIEEEIGHDN